MQTRFSVAIVDDHALVGLAIGALIAGSDGLDLVGAVPSVAALRQADLRPDLVVLDLMLRDGTTPGENVQRLRDRGSEVLVLTSGEDRFLVREALRTSALGVVRKSAPPDAILTSIERAARGELIMDAEWAMTADSDPDLQSAPLTDRERDVLALYASGIGAKQVATRLGISENTVNDHLKRIKREYQRLGRPAPTKVELYRRGVEDGFLPVPGRA
ncbi:DNA-binding NarL/FixJ family response regulator [Microbacterium ginsengiterrae]|uniref:DNA-binding NarL/FixJ family response regulator n=1 Tax=Microbacterium ginsengiterrae TaxID=546115 RepID=A0A7W9CBA7_9MICO|nr:MULTISPECIES: response regulator transcription factor [Microbacterium]MBB5742456.1 DNA-binding NarL/FixJ family response regulator [Microbacterium ginsengiterrae]